MANEARVFAEGVDNVIVRRVTVANANPLSKGHLLVFVGNSRTAVAHTTALGPVARPAGYTTSSKEASDGFTEIGVQRTGVVDAFVDGVASSGEVMVVSQTTVNRLRSIASAAGATDPLSYQMQNRIFGRALENAADGDQIRVAVTLG